jgi:hypothetical protein
VSYKADCELARFLSADRFSARPPAPPRRSDQKIPPEAQREIHLIFTPELFPSRTARRYTEKEAQRDCLGFLTALPGPEEDVQPLKGADWPLIMEWLKVPGVCIAALQRFLILRQDLLGLGPRRDREFGKPLKIPKYERTKYDADLPALTVRWMITDAHRAWRNPALRRAVDETAARGASIRLLLLLSFVPVAIFRMQFAVHRAYESDRRDTDPIVKRYDNPLSQIDEDKEAQRVRTRWVDELGFSPESEATLKARVASSYRTMDRDHERTIWRALGLDMTLKSDATRHDLWWWIASPIIKYIEPYAPSRKAKAVPRVTPDAVFTVASKLLNLRSNGLWPDRPDLLKSRNYYAL